MEATMATLRKVTFGTTDCVINTHFHVQVLDKEHRAIATAFAHGEEVTEDGQPIECVGFTEDQAADSMCTCLEKLYGAAGNAGAAGDTGDGGQAA